MHDEVKRLSHALDPALTQLRDADTELIKTATDHEMRLRELERRIWIAAGAASLGTGLIALSVQALSGTF